MRTSNIRPAHRILPMLACEYYQRLYNTKTGHCRLSPVISGRLQRCSGTRGQCGGEMASRKSSGQFCSAISCTNSRRKNPGLSFCRFPKDESRYGPTILAEIWRDLYKREWNCDSTYNIKWPRSDTVSPLGIVLIVGCSTWFSSKDPEVYWKWIQPLVLIITKQILQQ